MSLTIQVLAKYPNPVFIETGTKHGKAITHAIKLNFKEIHSVELDKKLYEYCKKKFQDKKFIHLYNGDSGIVLPTILKNITQLFTIWLDAHPITGSIESPDILRLQDCPLIQELKEIKKIKKSGDKILIDDMTMFSKPEYDQIISFAKTIGAISFENNDKAAAASVLNDILVIQ